MKSPRLWLAILLASAALAMALPARTEARVSCDEFTARRLERFTTRGERQIAGCLRRSASRGTTCPDERLTRSLARLHAHTVRALDRRCPDAGGDALVADAETNLLCETLNLCPVSGPFGTVTVQVTSGEAAPPAAAMTDPLAANATTDGGDATPSTLRLNVGWNGIAHNVRTLEGATYTAELSNCDGGTDTLCDLHGATAGTALAAPAPIGVGGVSFCLSLSYLSDITGSLDLASGALSEAAQIRVRISLSGDNERPCPTCVPDDGSPALGKAGTCHGGANDGASCVVKGLGDPAYGADSGTSTMCPPSSYIGDSTTTFNATTGQFTFATSPASPHCSAFGATDLRCLCDMCTGSRRAACSSAADCPAVDGVPATCGGRRCLGGERDNLPCVGSPDCTDQDGSVHPCSILGEPTRPNACWDTICTPSSDGGTCANGPWDGKCAIQTFRGCATAADCPLPGDFCAFVPRSCFLDPVELAGTPVPPVNGTASPTLVGGLCFGAVAPSSVNTTGSFPGPGTFVWPAEVTITPDQ
jgi:hypothetical protein